jgi:hypothetical protein
VPAPLGEQDFSHHLDLACRRAAFDARARDKERRCGCQQQ